MSGRKREIVKRYQQIAPTYDLLINLYYLIGFRGRAYREKAIKKLSLTKGSTVVEVGCGTGINFPLLTREVGPQGRIIAVDVSPQMLEVARRRVKRAGWKNVDLVECDGDSYEFPEKPEGILFSFAFRLLAHPKGTLTRAVTSLSPGGSLVVLDLKIPSYFPRRLGKELISLVAAPFGPGFIGDSPGTGNMCGNLLAEQSLEEYYFGSLNPFPERPPRRREEPERAEIIY